MMRRWVFGFIFLGATHATHGTFWDPPPFLFHFYGDKRHTFLFSSSHPRRGCLDNAYTLFLFSLFTVRAPSLSFTRGRGACGVARAFDTAPTTSVLGLGVKGFGLGVKGFWVGIVFDVRVCLESRFSLLLG